MTPPDRAGERCRDPSVELIATHLRTHTQLSPMYLISVYRITEGGDEVPVVVVTASHEPHRVPPQNENLSADGEDSSNYKSYGLQSRKTRSSLSLQG